MAADVSPADKLTLEDSELREWVGEVQPNEKLPDPNLSVQDAKKKFSESVKLSDAEREILSSTSGIEGFQALADNAQTSWNNKKRAGAREHTNNAVEEWLRLAKAIDPFITAASIIQPGVDAIWGTLGIVLHVVTEKNVKEKAMFECVRTLENLIPGRKFSVALYPNTRMKALLDELFQTVVKFLELVFLYFRRLRWKRTLYAILDPLNRTVQPLIDAIQSTSESIKDGCQISLQAENRLQSKALEKLKIDLQEQKNEIVNQSRTIEKQTEKIEEQTREIQRLREQGENARRIQGNEYLRSIKEKLVKREYDPIQEYNDCKELFQHHGLTFFERQYCKKLQDSQSIQEWHTQSSVSILWITSYRSPAKSTTLNPDRCLSYFVFNLHDELAHGSGVVFHGLPSIEGHITGKLLFHRFIYQLLVADPTPLEGNLYGDISRANDLSIFELARLAAKITNGQPIFWIIKEIHRFDFGNRAERICGNNAEKNARLSHFLEALKELVKGQSQLKVLITSNSLPTAMDENCDDIQGIQRLCV